MDDREPPLRIVVADDHALVRGGIGVLIKTLYQDSELVECNNYEKTLKALDQPEPVDLLLLDLLMPGMDLIRSVKHICTRWPDVPVIVISVREDMQTIREALRSGAMGYIPKTSSPDVTMNAIRLVLSGGIYVPPDALQLGSGLSSDSQLNEEFGLPAATASSRGAHGLTPRQEDVMQLMSEGRSNKEIAAELDLTAGTVKMHLSRIYKVLGAKSRTEAIAKYSKVRSKLPVREP
ncbi:MAG: response regulator [Parvibaculaceae bacterium]